MQINPDKRLWAFVIVFLAVFAWWMLGSDLEHIGDMNGPDNYALTTITDENIINMDTGALGGPAKSTSLLTGDTICFHADKYIEIIHIIYIPPFIFQGKSRHKTTHPPTRMLNNRTSIDTLTSPDYNIN